MAKIPFFSKSTKWIWWIVKPSILAAQARVLKKQYIRLLLKRIPGADLENLLGAIDSLEKAVEDIKAHERRGL